jgi:hypothetical protein
MRRLWLALPVALTAHCGGIARPNGGDLCVAGQRIECDCVGHTLGTRTCTAEGLGYGECVCSGGTGGGGTIDDAGGPPVESCTSKSAWMNGLKGAPEMTPGRACMACHATTPATPQYTIAGTIYSGLHDPDDCNGADGLGIAVAILDDNGTELGPRLQVNRVGNFFAERIMPARYRVEVIAGRGRSVMQTPVTNGDCNSCHTAAGTLGARGRMLKPMP